MATKPRSTPATPRRSPSKAAPAKPDAAFQKTRTRLDRQREKRRTKMMWVHYWLLCPKCGGDMFVQRTMGITYEVCRACHGIAIDGDELALLLDHLEAGPALRAILKKSKKPDTTEI